MTETDAYNLAHAEYTDTTLTNTNQLDFIVGEDETMLSSKVYNMSNAYFIQEVTNISNTSINEQLIVQGDKTTGHVNRNKLKQSHYRYSIDKV